MTFRVQRDLYKLKTESKQIFKINVSSDHSWHVIFLQEARGPWRIELENKRERGREREWTSILYPHYKTRSYLLTCSLFLFFHNIKSGSVNLKWEQSATFRGAFTADSCVRLCLHGRGLNGAFFPPSSFLYPACERGGALTADWLPLLSSHSTQQLRFVPQRLAGKRRASRTP